MKYNVIGDIHGRDCWKKLVEDDAINIFVGDYFDPYFYYPFEELENNFMDIILYANNHPQNTILLFGNHDYCPYVLRNERYSRYMRFHGDQTHGLFEENKDLIHGMAYSIGDKYLVTHAGLTKEWWDKWLKSSNDEIPTPKIAEDRLNELMITNKALPFTFRDNCDESDVYGYSAQQSPLWIRPYTLVSGHNIWNETSEYTQIVGHTFVNNSVSKYMEENGTNKVIFTDCLSRETGCLHIEENGDGVYNEYYKHYNDDTKELTLKEINIIKDKNEVY